MAYLNFIDMHLEEYSKEKYLIKGLGNIETEERNVINKYKEICSKFNYETRCITALCDRLLPKVYTNNCKKLVVECVKNKKYDKIKDFLGVYVVQTIFDYHAFTKMSNYDKKVTTFNTMVSAIRSVIKQENWDAKPFEETFQKIKELNYTNEYIWKTIYRKDRKYSAELFIQHEVEEITFTIRFRDKNKNIISETTILKEKPHDFVFSIYLGKFEWTSDVMVALYNEISTEKELTAKLEILYVL